MVYGHPLTSKGAIKWKPLRVSWYSFYLSIYLSIHLSIYLSIYLYSIGNLPKKPGPEQKHSSFPCNGDQEMETSTAPNTATARRRILHSLLRRFGRLRNFETPKLRQNCSRSTHALCRCAAQRCWQTSPGKNTEQGFCSTSFPTRFLP